MRAAVALGADHRGTPPTTAAGPAAGADDARLAALAAAPLDGAADRARALRIWFGDRLGRLVREGTLRAALDRDIAAIDALVGRQLDAILHHPRLRRLEGSWRGLSWLVERVDPGPKLKIRLLDLEWAELCRDLSRALEFDQSELFLKIYEQEFGLAGGEPFGLMVIDHEITHRPTRGQVVDDVQALRRLTEVAAAAFCPTVLAAAPALLELEDFAALGPLREPATPLRDDDHRAWRGIAPLEDARFLAVLLPRLPARTPWRDDPARADGFRYAEQATSVGERVWMSPGYAFAAVVVRAQQQHGWPADVRGTEIDRRGGGLVDGLPLEPYTTDPAMSWVRAPLEIVLTDEQERSLAEAGLVPICYLPHGREAAFGTLRSLHQPPRYGGATADIAQANARLSVQFNSVLCASRFAHYLKVMGRDMVGSFKTADELRARLQGWLNQFVNANPNAGADSRTRFPLVAGAVAVKERLGMPGSFNCTFHLQPYLQLDDINTSFQLVTEIAAPGGR